MKGSLISGALAPRTITSPRFWFRTNKGRDSLFTSFRKETVMAVVGASAGSVFASDKGTIGTSFTFEKKQPFPTPQNILAVPLLRYVSESDDQSVTEAFVSEFTDNGVSKPGHFMGVVATKCTHITWALFCDRSMNNPTKLIIFFG